MKVLRLFGLVLIGAFGLGFAALLALGIRPGAARNEVTIEIARPAAEVFPWLTEPEKLERWIGGLVESTPLTPGGVRVGAKSREVIAQSGQRYEMETEVTALQPNRLLAVRATSRGFDVNGRYELAEMGGRTRLTYIGVASYKMWFARLMEPVVTPAAQKAAQRNLFKLKDLIEAS